MIKKYINIVAKNGVNIGKEIIWIGITTTITLCVPVLYYYEKECQMYEIHAKMLQG